MDESHAAAQRQEAGLDSTPLVVVAFLAPAALLSLFLPDVYRLTALALLGLLALLLVLAAWWSHRAALAQARDPAQWAFITVVTLGAAMLLLLSPPSPASATTHYVCIDCGHRSRAQEAFCYQCGAQ